MAPKKKQAQAAAAPQQITPAALDKFSFDEDQVDQGALKALASRLSSPTKSKDALLKNLKVCACAGVAQPCSRGMLALPHWGDGHSC